MRRFALSVLLMAVFFALSCNKQDSESQNAASTPPEARQAIAWIETQKKPGADALNTRLQGLKENLDLDKARTEKTGERGFLVIPVKKGYEGKDSAGRLSTNVLALELTGGGEVLKGSVIQYWPKSGESKIPANTISRIFNNQNEGLQGKFRLTRISGAFSYELNFADNSLVSHRVKQPRKETSARNEAKTNGCTDWYLVTTYHYADGSTYTTEEYMYTTCSGCGGSGYETPECLEPGGEGGSGGGDGGVDYFYEEQKQRNWTVYEPNYFLYAPWGVYALDQLRAKKNANDPNGGHFTKVNNLSADCMNCASKGIVWDHTNTFENGVGAAIATVRIKGDLSVPNSPVAYIDKTKSYSVSSF